MNLVYSSESEEQFHGYSDADWANDPERHRAGLEWSIAIPIPRRSMQASS